MKIMLIVVLIVGGFLLAGLGLAVGFWLGLRVQRQHKQKPMEQVRRFCGEKAEPDPEIQRIQQILANIDNYDGTGRGQKEVE